MALKNSEYDEIMRSYSYRQSKNINRQRARQDALYEEIPRLRLIDEEVASTGAGAVRALFSGKADPSYKEKISMLSAERASLLKSAGYPADYLELTYDCPLCQDTGYVGGKKCSCFLRQEDELLHKRSQLGDILSSENFDTFSLRYYDPEIINEAGLSARDNALAAVKSALAFVEGFGRDFDNLFIYGSPGTGKTFLSHCIAAALLESRRQVLYYSAQDLFEELADDAFRRETPEREASPVFTCDLLIIDDLGTELTNEFVTTRLFLCINERLLLRRPTIISTNLSLEAFSERYSERVMSRIGGIYRMIKLFGRDIRFQKRFDRGAGDRV